MTHRHESFGGKGQAKYASDKVLLYTVLQGTNSAEVWSAMSLTTFSSLPSHLCFLSPIVVHAQTSPLALLVLMEGLPSSLFLRYKYRIVRCISSGSMTGLCGLLRAERS